MDASGAQSLTYRGAQEAFEPGAPLRKFGNPAVVCEGWYAVGRSKAWGRGGGRGAVKRVWIGARDLIVYRSLSGTMHGVESACPHLGADLAQGRVVDKGLQCSFHRWCWGAEGLCTAGGGVAEKRRIRTYAVRDLWGVVWVWAGGEVPAYEMPMPLAENTRHILRLPEQRLKCHAHVVLGNGLDFTHVGPVHGFHLQEDPKVEVDSPRLAVDIHTRFNSSFMRKVLRIAGRTATWRFTTIGPSLAWLTVHTPTAFELVWTGRPVADADGGGCVMQTVFFLPTWGSFVRALPMMVATTHNDRAALEGLRLRQGFVASDAVFHLYAKLIEGLEEWG